LYQNTFLVFKLKVGAMGTLRALPVTSGESGFDVKVKVKALISS